MRNTIFAVFLLISSCQPAFADTGVFLGAWSKHFSDYDYNEKHNLVGVSYNSIVAGYFKNSYHHDSFFAGYTIDIGGDSEDYSGFSGFALLGITRGYNYCYGSESFKNYACPFATVGVKYTTDYGINPQLLLLGKVVVLTLFIPFGEF